MLIGGIHNITRGIWQSGGSERGQPPDLAIWQSDGSGRGHPPDLAIRQKRKGIDAVKKYHSAKIL
ncbi:hypothetical protein QUF72_06965 [Desulfobacterales bacterium HSG2]|nr:hypothetical protein [Desulfobacterales bacterium HSG2]